MNDQDVPDAGWLFEYEIMNDAVRKLKMEPEMEPEMVEGGCVMSTYMCICRKPSDDGSLGLVSF